MCGEKAIGTTVDVNMEEKDGKYYIRLIGEITDTEEVRALTQGKLD